MTNLKVLQNRDERKERNIVHASFPCKNILTFKFFTLASFYSHSRKHLNNPNVYKSFYHDLYFLNSYNVSISISYCEESFLNKSIYVYVLFEFKERHTWNEMIGRDILTVNAPVNHAIWIQNFTSFRWSS